MAEYGKILVIGLGQLGASVALAARKYNKPARIDGVDISPKAVQACFESGVIDAGYLSLTGIKNDYSIVVICSPVHETAEIIAELSDMNIPNLLITDVGSTKHTILKALSYLPVENLAAYVPAHPLAGKEKAGYKHGSPDLFSGKKVFVTPCEYHNQQHLQMAKEFWMGLGAKILEMDAEEHDRIYALVSHLVQLLAYCYGDIISHFPKTMPKTPEYAKFFRLSRSSGGIWSSVFTENRENITAYAKRHLQNFKILFQSEKAKCFSAIPFYFAESLVGVVMDESNKAGEDITAYAAGAYPDFTSPASGNWLTKAATDIEPQVSRRDCLRIMEEYIELVEAGEGEVIQMRVNEFQKKLGYG